MRHVPDGSLLHEEFSFSRDLERALCQPTQFDSSHWLYVPAVDGEYRFILGERGARPIICVGINPSTARPDCLDPTLKRVKNLSKLNGYDGYLMLNVCALRATDPNDMERDSIERLHAENLEAFEYLFSKHSGTEIWAAWGNSIGKREYLIGYLHDIQRIGNEYDMKWVCMGATNLGNPRHPLFVKKTARFQPFDMDGYLAKRD